MNNRTQILLGTAILGTAILNVVAVVSYNKRIRQSEFDAILRAVEKRSGSGLTGIGGAFDKEVWKESSQKPKVSFDEANRLAVKIYEAKGKGWIITDNDNEAAVGDVFRMMKNISDVSMLSDAFYQKYRTELITFLESFLNQKEMNEYVISYISKLS